MSRRLAAAIHIQDDEGTIHSFVPGDVVPEWVASQITNPDAWASNDEVPADEVLVDTEPAGVDGEDGTDVHDGAVPPPRSGKGSGVEAWVAYARANDFDVADDARREDIIDGLAEAGIPVE